MRTSRLGWLLLATLLVLGGLWAARDLGPSPAGSRLSVDSPGSEPTTRTAVQSRVATWPGLVADERRGGHTLARHVAKSDAELAARLRRESDLAEASSFDSPATAEAVVRAALSANAARIAGWIGRDRRPNLAVDAPRSTRPVGRTLRRGEPAGRPAHSARVVLRSARPGEFHVLTAYPTESR